MDYSVVPQEDTLKPLFLLRIGVLQSILYSVVNTDLCLAAMQKTRTILHIQQILLKLRIQVVNN